MRTIDARWLDGLRADALQQVLVEYWHLVKRFPQWLALTIGNAEDEHVRQALVPNLSEESGLGGRPSHRVLLESLLSSCGLLDVHSKRSSPQTLEIERWFVALFAARDTLASLCVLGPGTEAISQDFLQPLETGVMHAFPQPDVRYFDAHRPEVDRIHAQRIEGAIEFLIARSSSPKEALEARSRWTESGIAAHARFWEFLRHQLGSGVVG